MWHKLAWVDPFYLDSDPRVQRLIRKQRNFTEDDKARASRGRARDSSTRDPRVSDGRRARTGRAVDVTVLPSDSAAAVRHRHLPADAPGAAVPRPPFRHPEDAADHLARARQCHLRLFGHEPAGALAVGGIGVGRRSRSSPRRPASTGWRPTKRSWGARIDREFRRDAQGRVEQPEPLYRAYDVHAGSSQIRCLFRDHSLSDLIGFVYAGWNPEAAATDFVNRLVEAGRRFSAASGGEEATISIILDGENAWEHFEGGGRPFLRALYGKLSGHPELRPVKMSEAAARPARPLNGIFPGSWIDANFFIWIGHGDDLRAWRQLREARQMFERSAPAAIADRPRTGVSGAPDRRGQRLVLVVRRRSLVRARSRIRRSVPAAPAETSIRCSDSQFPKSSSSPISAPDRSRSRSPRRSVLLQPVLDGERTSYFEWLAAGSVETDVPSGTMTGGERREPSSGSCCSDSISSTSIFGSTLGTRRGRGWTKAFGAA